MEAPDRRVEERRSAYGRHFLRVLEAQSAATFTELAQASRGVGVLISEALEWVVQAEATGIVEYLPMLGDVSMRRIRLTERGRTLARNDRRASDRRAA